MSKFTDAIIIELPSTKAVATFNLVLNNNHRRDNAVLAEDGSYAWTNEKGAVKHYGLSQIKSVVSNQGDVEEEIKENNNMGYNFPLPTFHYMQTVNKGFANETLPRYVQNYLDEDMADFYAESLITKRPVKEIFAITTGGWEFHLLKTKLAGHQFKLMIIENKQLDSYPVETLDLFVDKSVFAYANASHSFFLQVKGQDKFGISELLGINVRFGKKAAKRCQELFRITEIFASFPAGEIRWTYKAFKGMDPILFDGMSYMTQELAIKVIRKGVRDQVRARKLIRDVKSGKLTRCTLRFMDEEGLGKGDVTIVNKLSGGWDLVTYTANVKDELIVVDGEFHINFWEHAPRHLAVWDDQTTVNFPMAFTEAKQAADIRFMIQNVKDSLAKGIIPEWLMIGEKDRDENGVPDIEKLSDSLGKQWIMWQTQHHIMASGNLSYLGIGMMEKRMDTKDRRYLGDKVYRRKLWIAMSNAILASVSTWESCTMLGEMTFPGRDGANFTFFDPRVGFVMPGHRFIETYDLHGGFDQDDNLKGVLIKLWASGDYSQHLGSTLDSRVKLATTPEEAGLMLLMVRSPNGPCEYSIEMVDTRGMFVGVEELLNEKSVVTIDMCAMPRPQAIALAEDTVIEGLVNTTQYRPTESMTADDAKAMIKAQLLNPGFGRVCNAMMGHAHVKPGTFPAQILDRTENIVDASQMGFDIAQFAKIAVEHENIWGQLLETLEAEGGTIDPAFAAVRIPADMIEDFAPYFKEDRFSRIQAYYERALEFLKKELLNVTMQWRAESELGKAVMTFNFSEYEGWAKSFTSKFALKIAEIENDHVVNPTWHPFTKMEVLSAKTKANHALVAEMVSYFTSIESDSARHTHVVALYQYMVKNYRQDRIIFQPAAAGELSVMHILMEGVEYFAHRRFVAGFKAIIG